jgi:putative transposase
MKRSRF